MKLVYFAIEFQREEKQAEALAAPLSNERGRLGPSRIFDGVGHDERRGSAIDTRAC